MEFFINHVPVTHYEYDEYVRSGYQKYNYFRKNDSLIHLDVTPKEVKRKLKIYNIDIKKCRKNNLFYSKY